MMGKFFRVCSVHEIPAGTGKMVQVEGKTTALFNLAETSMPLTIPDPMRVGHFPLLY